VEFLITGGILLFLGIAITLGSSLVGMTGLGGKMASACGQVVILLAVCVVLVGLLQLIFKTF
jgi:hypothetical protein